MARPAPSCSRPPLAYSLAVSISEENASLFTVILRSPLHLPPSSRIQVVTGSMEALYPWQDLLPQVLLHALRPQNRRCPQENPDSEIPVPPARHPPPPSLSLARDPVSQASWSIVGVSWALRKPLRCSSGCPSSTRHSPDAGAPPKQTLGLHHPLSLLILGK